MPCLPGVESGKQARRGGEVPCTHRACRSVWCPAWPGPPATPSPPASPGLPVPQLLVTHRGAGRLHPPSRPGHRVRHLPLRQEAPGPVLGGPASREAWLVICVATWPPRAAPAGLGPGCLPEAGPGLGTGTRHSTPGGPPEPPAAGRRRGGGEEWRAVPSPFDTLSLPRLFAQGSWLPGTRLRQVPSPACTRRPGSCSPGLRWGRGCVHNGYGLPAGVMKVLEGGRGGSCMTSRVY